MKQQKERAILNARASLTSGLVTHQMVLQQQVKLRARRRISMSLTKVLSKYKKLWLEGSYKCKHLADLLDSMLARAGFTKSI